MILALDQALAHTGWAYYCPALNRVLVGEHTTKPKQDLWDRLASIQDLLAFFRPHIEQLLVEKVYGSNRDLIRVETAVLLFAHHESLPYEALAPQQNNKDSWRAPLPLADSSKQAVIDWVALTWGEKVNSHQADALAILWAWLQRNHPYFVGLNPPLENFGKKRPAL